MSVAFGGYQGVSGCGWCLVGFMRDACVVCGSMDSTQRAQYPLIKEYTLNHNIKAPII